MFGQYIPIKTARKWDCCDDYVAGLREYYSTLERHGAYGVRQNVPKDKSGGIIEPEDPPGTSTFTVISAKRPARFRRSVIDRSQRVRLSYDTRRGDWYEAGGYYLTGVGLKQDALTFLE